MTRPAIDASLGVRTTATQRCACVCLVLFAYGLLWLGVAAAGSPHFCGTGAQVARSWATGTACRATIDLRPKLPNVTAWKRRLAAIAIPQDPRWYKARKQLGAATRKPRWRALRWLAKEPSAPATAMLLLAMRHPEQSTRGWAAAALRTRPGKAVVQALTRALSDVSVATRLNAVVALGTRGMFSKVQPKLKDSAALVREAACGQLVRYAFEGYPRKAPTPVRTTPPTRTKPTRRRNVRRTRRRPPRHRARRRAVPRPKPPKVGTTTVPMKLTNGKYIVRPNTPIWQQRMKRCLRDAAGLVRLGTAEVLLQYNPNVPFALQKQALAVLRKPKRRPYRAIYRRRYSARWRLNRALRSLRAYRKNLLYRIKRTNGMYDAKRRGCFRKYKQALLGQIGHFRRWHRDYLRFARAGKNRLAQVALSRALLTFRTAQLIYNRANTCHRLYPAFRVKRKYKRLLRKALILPGAPTFMPTKSWFRVGVSTWVVMDSAFDTLRNDIHPHKVPETARLSGPFLDGIFGGQIELQGDIKLTKRLRLAGHIKAGGQFVFGFQQLSGFDGDLKLRLLYGRRERRHRSVAFLEEELKLIPGLFGQNDDPNEYAGRRLVQHFRIGGTWRWGRHYRRWTRWDEWAFHASYHNKVHVPLLEEVQPLVWAPRVEHFLKLEIQRQLYFFWFGAKGTLRFDHFLQDSARVPTFQGAAWATFALNNPYDPIDLVRIEGGVGYGFLTPLSTTGVTPAPTPSQAGEVASPLAYVGVFGHLSRLPIQWRLRYWHRFGGPVRPPYSHFIEDRIHGEVRFGQPRELLDYLPRRLEVALGFKASVAGYGIPPEDNEDKPKVTLEQPKYIRNISIYVQLIYPLFLGFRLVVGDELSFVRNELVPYQSGTGGPLAGPQRIDSVRNVLYIKLEYWLK